MNTIGHAINEYSLPKKKFLHNDESIFYSFENNDKKSKETIIITNKRVFHFNEIRNIESLQNSKNYQTFTFSEIEKINIINQFKWVDIEIKTGSSNFLLRKFKKDEALKIKTILHTMKLRKTIKTDHDTNDSAYILQINTDFQKHEHKYNHKTLRYRQKHTHKLEPYRTNILLNSKEYLLKKYFCSNCGVKSLINQDNCNNCGESLLLQYQDDSVLHQEEKTLCPYCNAKVYLTDNFCQECGRKLSSNS